MDGLTELYMSQKYKIVPEFNEAPHHKGVRESECKAPRILNLSIRRSCVVSFTPWPLYPWGKCPRYPLYLTLGGPQTRFECGGKEKHPCFCRESNQVYMRRSTFHLSETLCAWRSHELSPSDEACSAYKWRILIYVTSGGLDPSVNLAAALGSPMRPQEQMKLVRSSTCPKQRHIS